MIAGPAMLVERPRQLLELGLVAAGLDHRVAQVGAVEAGDEERGVAELELVGDVAADGVGGRGRQRDAGRRAELLAGLAEPGVVGPEVVPPLADAVGLVDGQQAGLEPGHHGDEPRAAEPFGGDVDQVEAAGLDLEPSVRAARRGRACC